MKTKKIIVGSSIALAIVITTFFGCQKETIAPGATQTEITSQSTSRVSNPSSLNEHFIVFSDQPNASEVTLKRDNEVAVINSTDRIMSAKPLPTSRIFIFDNISTENDRGVDIAIPNDGKKYWIIDFSGNNPNNPVNFTVAGTVTCTCDVSKYPSQKGTGCRASQVGKTVQCTKTTGCPQSGCLQSIMPYDGGDVFNALSTGHSFIIFHANKVIMNGVTYE